MSLVDVDFMFRSRVIIVSSADSVYLMEFCQGTEADIDDCNHVVLPGNYQSPLSRGLGMY